jgi:hypothetical protein
MNQTVKTIHKAKMYNSDLLIDLPRKFKYFYDPYISPFIIPITITEKLGSR